MIFQGVYFARIVATNQKDFNILNSKYENTGVVVELCDYINLKLSELPTIFFGKAYSALLDKEKYNIIEILDSNIEDKLEIFKRLTFLLEKIIFTFYPYEYIVYDAILNNDNIFDFLMQEIDSEKEVFLFFYKKCLYLYCSGKLISISLESIQYTTNNFKLTVDGILQKFKCYIFSFSNFKKYVTSYEDIVLLSFENIIWCKHSLEIDENNMFQHFAGIPVYRNIPYLMDVYLRQNPITNEEIISINRFYKKDIVTEWLSTREIYFNNNVSGFNLHEKTKNLYYTTFNYSNKRTITGRINSFDDQVNLQMLPKNSEIKNNIISRYKNGKIVVYDYISFESRVAIFATGNKDFIDKFSNKDMHVYIAQLIFQHDEINREERSVGKLFNHALLFGGGEERLKSIIKDYDDKINFEVIYDKILEELNPIIELSLALNQEFLDYNYIRNAYGVIIRPRKNYAAFSNFIQSTAADIVVDKIFDIKNFLLNKNIHFMYQIYDSFIFDFDESEIHQIKEIENLLSKTNKISFPVNHQVGNTLMECGSQEIESWQENS